MARMALYFDLPDEMVSKLIPSVQIHAEITTYGEGKGTVYISERTDTGHYQGKNAEIKRID